MRYVVKAYTMTDAARALAEQAIADGLIADPERAGGFVEGSCSAEDVRALVARGLDIRTTGTLPDVPEPGAGARFRGGFKAMRLPNLMTFGTRPAGRPAPDQEVYYRIVLRGAVTAAIRARLANAGAALLERQADGSYTSRSRRSAEDLEADPSIVSATPLVEARRARARTFRLGLAVPSADGEVALVLEALLQPGAESDELAGKLRQRGADIILVMKRAVRFAQGRADLDQLRSIPEVAQIAPVGGAELFHDRIRPLVGVHRDAAMPTALVYHGEDEVVGIADTGIDVTHLDFAGRIVAAIARGRPGDASDPNGHGTHVAGTIAGDGAASTGLLAGIAPKARIFFQSVLDGQGGLGGLPGQLEELFQEAYDAGVRVHNNSWGAFLHSRYNGMSLDLDSFVHDHPDFLAVVAAGNDGSCLPGDNIKREGFVDYPSTSAPASAKNCLTVGASRSNRQDLGFATLTYNDAWPKQFPLPPIATETISGDSDALAGFSARGPCDDMRIKPDVVAPGTDIASTRSADAPLRNFWGSYPNNPHYALMGGTSMACPVVTGLAVIVRQYYRQTQGHMPSAALLKATIINGAIPLTGADAIAAPGGRPGPHQGAGRVNLLTTIPLEGQNDLGIAFVDDVVVGDTGDFVHLAFTLARDGPLRLCLAWTDPPGRGLQNSFMMQLQCPDGTVIDSNADVYAPLVLRGDDPFSDVPRLMKRDPNNNVHSIQLEAPAGAYELFVVADNFLHANQAFALVATGPVRDFKQN